MSAIWDAVAAVGAASGIPALGWQVWTWRQSGPHVEVRVANAFPVYAGQQLGEHHFQITAVNTGRAPAEVSSWGVRLPDGSNLVMFQQLPFSDDVGRLEPHAQRRFFVNGPATIAQLRTRGIRADQCRPYVVLTTGDEVMGKALPWEGS